MIFLLLAAALWMAIIWKLVRREERKRAPRIVIPKTLIEAMEKTSRAFADAGRALSEGMLPAVRKLNALLSGEDRSE